MPGISGSIHLLLWKRSHRNMAWEPPGNSRCGTTRTTDVHGTSPAQEARKLPETGTTRTLKEHNVVRDFIRDAFESAGLDAETGPTHTASRSGGASAHIYHRQDSGGRRPVRRWRQSQNSLFGYPLLRLSAVSRWSSRCGLSTYARTSTEAITAASAGHIRMKEILIFVNLRSLRLTPAGCALYAGGGINEIVCTR